jgi:IgA Peptidase M64
MGAGDGYIGATTKIVDHGPDSSRYTIAILGDGYQASELPKYHADVQAFVDTIFNTAPYTDVWCGINIYRIDVASTESGADDPADCPDQSDGPPTGATAKTFFDATFCSTGPGGVSIHRLLSVDSTGAMAASKAQVPLRQLTIVIVNTPIYGGSGGPVAV